MELGHPFKGKNISADNKIAGKFCVITAVRLGSKQLKHLIGILIGDIPNPG
jgi:hypothetical protein